MLIFVMGADTGAPSQTGHCPNTAYTDYYLHSDGQCQHPARRRRPLHHPASGRAGDTFVYDPHQPVPTVGGQVLMPGANSIGPRDQRPVEDRDDVLVYSTPA